MDFFSLLTCTLKYLAAYAIALSHFFFCNLGNKRVGSFSQLSLTFLIFAPQQFEVMRSDRIREHFLVPYCISFIEGRS